MNYYRYEHMNHAFNKIFNIFSEATKTTAKSSLRGRRYKKTKTFNFNAMQIGNDEIAVETSQLEAKKKIYLLSTPHLVKLYDKLVLKNMSYSYKKIKPYYTANKIYEALMNYADKKYLVKYKEDFLTKYKKLVDHKKAVAKSKACLKQMTRMFILKSNSKMAAPIRKHLNLVYVLRLTFMHKSISMNIFLKDLIKHWRFYVYLEKQNKKQRNDKLKNLGDELKGILGKITDYQNEENEDAEKNKESKYKDLAEKLGLLSQDNSKEDLAQKQHKKYCSKTKKKYQFKNEMNEEGGDKNGELSNEEKHEDDNNNDEKTDKQELNDLNDKSVSKETKQ